MELLAQKEEFKFYIDTEFKPAYLMPIQKYVQWKLENNWDDYNELFHAAKLIEGYKKQSGIWFHTHLILKEEQIAGVLFIVGGKIKILEDKYAVEPEDQSVLLKYFHIVEKGKGLGTFWLKSVILPYYKQRNYTMLFVNSSHPNSFPFYSRLGTPIASYVRTSDNQLSQREGRSFRIEL